METTGVAFDENSPLGLTLKALGPFGFVAVDPGRVNMDDLLGFSGPGQIVRVRGNPHECIRVIASGSDESLGCVAGWISEQD